MTTRKMKTTKARKNPIHPDLGYEQRRKRIEEARQAYEDAKGRFEKHLDDLLRGFCAADPDAARIDAELVAAEASGNKEAERIALAEWNAKYFNKFTEVQRADAELTRLYHERAAAWKAYGAAVGPSDDEEADE